MYHKITHLTPGLTHFNYVKAFIDLSYPVETTTLVQVSVFKKIYIARIAWLPLTCADLNANLGKM